MPMSDEIASASLSAAQKSMELTAELLKLLAPLPGKLVKNALGITKELEGKAAEKKTGLVNQQQLLNAAVKAKCSTLSNDNFPAKDTSAIVKKASEYGIPIMVVGNGEKQSISYLERDKVIVNQIIQDVMAERMREAPQSMKSFSLKEIDVEALKSQFDENNIDCQFTLSSDGKVFCVYNAEDKEKVDIIKEDFRNLRSDILEKFTATETKTGAVITDAKTGKSIDLEKYGDIKKYQVVNLCMKEFGYSRTEAELAANKMCDDLKLNPEKFIMPKRQIDEINRMATNIHYESDSILLRDTTFAALNLKGGENTAIFISKGDSSAVLSPSVMDEVEMKNICMSHLSMSEEEASETVSKAVTIDKQIKSKLKETVIDKNTGIAHSAEIERTANNSFSVKVGAHKKSYDLSAPDIAQKISKDFGIPLDKANNIVEKAKKQSPLMNKIKNGFDKATNKADKTVDKISKGVKR